MDEKALSSSSSSSVQGQPLSEFFYCCYARMVGCTTDDKDLHPIKDTDGDKNDDNGRLIIDRDWVWKLVQQGEGTYSDASTTAAPGIEDDIYRHHHRHHRRHHPSVQNKILATAPMIEQSDTAFRILTRRYGSNLCFTPMIHAYSFVNKPSYRRKMFHFGSTSSSSSSTSNGSNNKDNTRSVEVDRPLIAQIAGSNKEILLKCAQMLQGHVDAIDINLGCPTLTAKRRRYGAYLLGSGDYVVDIVKYLVDHIHPQCPITCKVRLVPLSRSKQKEQQEQQQGQNLHNSDKETTASPNNNSNQYEASLRLGYDLQASLRLYKGLIDAGAKMLTVHGRTKDMRGPNSQAADWDAIRVVVEELGHQVPILANGSLASYEDVIRCLEYTKADGVMSSEAILEYPPSLYMYNHHPSSSGGDDMTTITTTAAASKSPTKTRPTCRPGPGRLGIAREYLELCRQYPPSEGNGGTGMQCIIMHMTAFLHGEWASGGSESKKDFNDNTRKGNCDVELVEDEDDDDDDDEPGDDDAMQSRIRNSKTVDDLIEVLKILEKRRHQRTNHKIEDETLSWYYRHWRPEV